MANVSTRAHASGALPSERSWLRGAGLARKETSCLYPDGTFPKTTRAKERDKIRRQPLSPREHRDSFGVGLLVCPVLFRGRDTGWSSPHDDLHRVGPAFNGR